MESVLLSIEDYVRLRGESREALYRLGIRSNPGFTDKNILDGLSCALGKEGSFTEADEWSEYSGEFFRDSLGEIFNLDIPPSVEKIVTHLRNLT